MVEWQLFREESNPFPQDAPLSQDGCSLGDGSAGNREARAAALSHRLGRR